MNGRTIGGQIGMHELAQLHRPRSRDEMRAAAVEMRQRGMSVHTIAVACGIAVEQVRQLLEQRETAP